MASPYRAYMHPISAFSKTQHRAGSRASRVPSQRTARHCSWGTFFTTQDLRVERLAGLRKLKGSPLAFWKLYTVSLMSGEWDGMVSLNFKGDFDEHL